MSQLQLLSRSAPKITLRPYQERVVTDTLQAIATGSRSPLIVAGTGSGKTVIAAELLRRFVGQGLRCLFAVHLDVLVGQTASKLESFGLDHGFIKAGFSESRDAPVQVASCQTLPRRQWWKSHQFDVIVWDEAHKTAWTKVAGQLMEEYYPDSIHVGLTATPWRMAKKEGMADKFDALVLAPLPSDLMESGYLVFPRYFGLPKPQLEGVRTVGGDYNQGQLSTRCNQPELVQRLVQEYQRLCPGKRAIAFSVDVAHAFEIAQAFNRSDIPAAAVSGDTPIAQRNQIYRQLEGGDILVLASCNVTSEGFDVPSVEVVLLARPTQSRALYFQQMGRGLRPAPDKETCWILDQAGNVSKFGFVEDLTKHSLRLTHGVDSDGIGEMPVKDCPECGALLRIVEQECPHCGHSFRVEETAPNAAMVELKGKPKSKPKKQAKTQQDLLDALWNQVLEQMPPMSKGLLKEHGKLVATTELSFFDQVTTGCRFQAEIEVPSLEISKIAQSRTDDVAAAFYKATGFAYQPIPVVAPEIESGEDKISAPNSEAIDKLVSTQQERGYKKGWIFYRMVEIPALTRQDFLYLAKQLNYKSGWGHAQFAKYQEHYGV